MQHWAERAEIPAKRLLGWMELSSRKFHQWKDRYGKANEHNGQVPRDWWLEDWEKQAILDYHDRHLLEGYRSPTFMMLDDDIVAASPSSVYRVLKQAGRLDQKWQKTPRKGDCFVQPLQPHEHWHIDVAHINIGGTFFFLCSLLDGFSAIKSSRMLAPADNKTGPPPKRLPDHQTWITTTRGLSGG